MDGQWTAISVQPRSRPERMDYDRQLREWNPVHRIDNGLLFSREIDGLSWLYEGR